MTNVLYEVTYRLDRGMLIPFIVAAGFLFFFVREIKAIRCEKTAKGHRVNLCIFFIGLALGFVVCVIEIVSQIDMYQNIVAAYHNGQYATVEGYVEDFVPMPAEGHAHETFQINGVAFDYSDNTALQGYNKPKVHGGVISGDGQHLKIRYIYYAHWDCNVIVYIEELSP